MSSLHAERLTDSRNAAIAGRVDSAVGIENSVGAVIHWMTLRQAGGGVSSSGVGLPVPLRFEVHAVQPTTSRVEAYAAFLEVTMRRLMPAVGSFR